MKILKFSLITATLLSLVACGGGGSSGGTPTPSPDSSSPKIVPQKINIDIPDGLKNQRDNRPSSKISFQKATETIPSYGYRQLRDTISETERTIKEVKENLVLLNSIMPDIQKECEGTPINTKCTIPAGVISLTIDNTIQSELKEVDSEFDSPQEEALPPLNTKLVMGEIVYTLFDTTHTYQQDVVLDLKPTLKALGLDVSKELETVRWSDDKNSVETISDVADEDGAYTMHLIYKKDTLGSSKMSISNTYSLTDNSSGTFSLEMNETKDANNTVTIKTAGSNTFDNFKDTFNENGSIGDNGGFLVSKGSFDGNKFAEKETFDKDGNLLQSKYCEEPDSSFDSICNMNDQTTWHTFDSSLGIDSDEFVEDEFLEDDFIGDDENFVFESVELEVEGGELQDGICELLPPTFDTSKLPEADGISENSIGNIFSFDNSSDGALYNNSYVDQLNDLKVVCFYPTADGKDAEFTELTGSSRPTLRIKSEQ